MTRTSPVLFLLLFLCASCAQETTPDPTTTTITLIGTNDVHGQLLPDGERGGLVSLSGYVQAVRDARAADGGHMLLIDAGDMWQGTLESNLSEGAATVAAFNALQYDAVALGNHEFDFGPVGPKAIPESAEDDRRGALKERAREANFPLLSANLAYKDTGKPIEWPNVYPSTMVDAGEFKIGIIGILTSRALVTTIAANVDDLVVLPLAPAIIEEAAKLRADGADIVVVTAHAGGQCEDFSDPNDLSSCVDGAEIFGVARALPPGTVDHIFAGHVHQGIAHIVNGVSISSAFSNTRAFSRVDFELEKGSGDVVARRLSPPHQAVIEDDYEGSVPAPTQAVVEVAEEAREFARYQKNLSLGVTLEEPFTLAGNPESTLGNLFTQALLAELDADVALHNVQGGLRADLPAGPLTFGSVYQISPFENRVVILNLSGAQLRAVIAGQAYLGRRRAGFSGMSVAASCENDVMRVTMTINDVVIEDDDEIRVIVNDYLALGGDAILNPILPDGGFAIDTNMPMTRDVFIDWVMDAGDTLHPDDFVSSDAPKWTGDFPIPRSCVKGA